MALPPEPYVSLFSGCGWLDLAVSLAFPRARCVGYVEREAYAAATLVARMEDSCLDQAPVWDDVCAFPSGLYRGRVAGVVAGWPCPPVSAAGKRKGVDDERWLWPEVVRVIRETGARWFLGENVRGLLSANAGREFGEVLRDLACIGFAAEWITLAARDVGASHERERVFLLAHTKDDHGRRGECGKEEGTRPDGIRRRGSSGGRRELADTRGARLQGGKLRTPRNRDGHWPEAHGPAIELRGLLPVFAVGPKDTRWADVIEVHPHHAPAIEPGFRVLAHGRSLVVDESRADQLRLGGNGVVALCGAAAARELDRRLGSELGRE